MSPPTLVPQDAVLSSSDGLSRSVKCCPECAQHYSADSMFCPFDGAKLEDMIWVAPTDPSVDPLLGTVIDGRYRVERVLGEGGTGTVYEVLHESLARPFAMKVLRADVALDAGLASRFIQEAKATASLRHPHIVSITDFGRLPDKTPYFVMERLVGQTLARACKVGGKLPLDRAVRIVMQVADALSAAHEAGIVHRDLKPENLFLVGRLEGEIVKTDDLRVVDFGAAKIAGATRLTKTGIVFGTPHYMSPEQASGQPVDHRADIYALGVIMYEVLSGRLPFEADTLMGVLTKHMFVAPPRFAEASGSPAGDDTEEGRATARLVDALERVTFRAMAKKPEERFQTMGELAAELARTVVFDAAGGVHLADGWVAPPVTRSQRPPRSSREPPAPSSGRERADRADVYPSGDLPVIPKAPVGARLVAGLGVVALAAVVVSASLVRNVAPPPLPGVHPGGEAVVGAASPSLSSSSPSNAMPAPLHPPSVPSSVEVAVDSIAPPPATSAAPPAPSAVRAPPPRPARPSSAASPASPAPRRHRSASDGELVDPFSR